MQDPMDRETEEMFPDEPKQEKVLTEAEMLVALDIAIRPQFVAREILPVKGYHFRVKGYTESGDLILSPQGPSGKLLKRLRRVKKALEDRMLTPSSVSR